MKSISVLLASLVSLAGMASASTKFDSCIAIDRPTFKTYVSEGKRPILGPDGPVIILDAGCVFLDVNVPGFQERYPEVHAAFVSANEKLVARKEDTAGAPVIDDRAPTSPAARDVLDVETQGCGQVCAPGDPCLWPCTCRYYDFDCFNDGFDTECWDIYKCQG